MSRPMGTIGEYAVTSKLGSGSFAVVYRGFHKQTKVPVAIKAISLAKLNRKLQANLESEIAIMKQIDHPNIVKLYDLKKTEKHIYLILEFCAGGDLQQFVKRQQAAAAGSAPTTMYGHGPNGNNVPTIPLSEPVAQHFLRELAKGLKCLWTRNLIHRDLKPQNLLLATNASDSVLKIADFGFARHLAETSMAETLCGSPLYMAPEILKFQKYDAKADLWSVGTILYEMVVGKPPFGGANHVQLLANIERQELRFPPQTRLSHECQDLLKGLLRRNPLVRMSFDEFFQHPFVGLASSASTSASPSASRSSSPSPVPSSPVPPVEDGGPQARPVATPPQAPGSVGMARAPLVDLSMPMAPANAPVGSHNKLTNNGANTGATMTEIPSTARKLLSNPMPRARRSVSGGLPSTQPPTSTGSTLRLTNDGTFMATPSPRINPFKPLSESPPGAAALLSNGMDTVVSSSSSSSSSLLRHSMSSATTLRKSRTSLTRATALTPKQRSSSPVPPPPPPVPPHQQHHALVDTSDDFVLVDTAESGSDKAPSPPPPGVPLSAPTKTLSLTPPTKSAKPPLRRSNSNDTNSRKSPRELLHQHSPSGCTLAEDLETVHIMLYRIEAIAPIAESLWKTSLTTSSFATEDGGGSGSGSGSGTTSNCLDNSQSHFLLSSPPTFGSAVLSMPSPTSSGTSSGGSHHQHQSRLSRSSLEEEKVLQFHIAACNHALLLYVKCLRLMEHAIRHFKNCCWSNSKSSLRSAQLCHATTRHGKHLNKHKHSTTTTTTTTRSDLEEDDDHEHDGKVSLASLTDQLSFFLERAEACKKRLNLCLLEQERGSSGSGLSSCNSTEAAAGVGVSVGVGVGGVGGVGGAGGAGGVGALGTLKSISVEELLYGHALRLSKEGAVKEVLGQTSVAHDLYLQAMLLLETLVMDEPRRTEFSCSKPPPQLLSKDDLERIARFISALETRICSVQQTLSARQPLDSLPEAD